MWTAETLPAGVLPRLVVPAVEKGDVGLVLAVHELEWDGGFCRWWLVGPEERRYVLPGELHAWARRVDHEVRRSCVRLPALFAFSWQSGSMAARQLMTW